MRLTTKGRYAVTAMLDLALNHEQGPIRLAGISDRQGISLSYLEQLFALLRRRELVRSVRGPGGGYHLGRHASTISVADVIAAVNEDTDTTAAAVPVIARRAKPVSPTTCGQTCQTRSMNSCRAFPWATWYSARISAACPSSSRNGARTRRA